MDPNSQTAEASTPLRSFYKIILPSIIKDNKLRIPEDFAKVYEKELSSFATLNAPNGRAFRIKLEKSEKMIWFRKGWKEFSEYYLIECGFFVVFDYEGNSNFKVHIFDLTATEIEYPKTLGTHEEPKNEIINSVKRKREKKKKSDMIFSECSQKGINRKRCLHLALPILFQFAPELAMRINNCKKCIMKKSYYKKRNKRGKLGDLSEVTILEDVVSSKDKSKAIAVLNSHIKSDDEKGQTFAEDSEDTQLATPINIDYHNVKVKQENEEELIGVNDSNILSTRSIIQDKGKAVNAALMLKLKNPYFMSILKKQNVDLSFILNVPAYFGNKHLSSETQYLKLEGPDGKHLEVSCFSNGEVQYLSRGWVTFVKEYKLVEGDVCIFEFIQVDNKVLKVHIFRASQTSP